MKKIFSTVAAFGLVAGLASTAAAVDFSVTGRYVAEGYYKSDGDFDGVYLSDAFLPGLEEPGSDAYFVHSFKMAPVFQVNDKVKMVTDIWLADNNFWGNQYDTRPAAQGQALSPDQTDKDVEVWQLYLEYLSPVGKLRVGRHLAGPFGTSFLDTVFHRDRIMYWPEFLKFGGFSTLLKYQKSVEGDGGLENGSALNNALDNLGLTTIPDSPVTEARSDGDSDYYEFDVFHKSDAGLGLARIGYTNNRVPANSKTTEWRFTVSGNYELPAVYLQAEVDYRWGETEFDAIGTPDTDVSKLAAFAQVGTKIGALDVSGMAFYASGDDNPFDNDDEAVGALGDEFEPYYILTGSHAGIYNTEIFETNAAGALAREAGIISLGAHVNYSVSDQLTLHGAVAYAMAESELDGFDDELGYEANVGAAYKLLDNLTYEAHFGYLMTGDFFELAGAADTNDVWLLSHHLTMTF